MATWYWSADTLFWQVSIDRSIIIIYYYYYYYYYYRVCYFVSKLFEATCMCALARCPSTSSYVKGPFNFFQVLTPEFRDRALAQAQGLYLELGHWTILGFNEYPKSEHDIIFYQNPGTSARPACSQNLKSGHAKCAVVLFKWAIHKAMYENEPNVFRNRPSTGWPNTGSSG